MYAGVVSYSLFFLYHLWYIFRNKRVLKIEFYVSLIFSFSVAVIFGVFKYSHPIIGVWSIVLLCLYLLNLGVVIVYTYRNYSWWDKMGKYIVLMIVVIYSIGATATVYIIKSKTNKDNYFTSVTSTELEDIIAEQEDNIIYFGRPTCPQCKEFESLIREKSSELEHLIYYFNIDEAREENEEYLNKIMEEYELRAVPTVMITNNGQILKVISDSDVEQMISDVEQKFKSL